MLTMLRSSLIVLLLMTLLTGVLYPLAITGAAQVLFPSAANGSLIVVGGRPVGSTLIGQPFSAPGYFWSRPSATSPVPYQAAASSGSNLGPLNDDLAKNVAKRIAALKQGDSEVRGVPIDLVTASGSGLDPHISPDAAALQVHRVAQARGLDDETVRQLVLAHTEGRQFGFLGEPRVNVLLLNLAVDERARHGSDGDHGMPPRLDQERR